MSQLEPNDLFLVNRSDASYKVSFENIKENLGGLEVNPTPGDTITTPSFESGNGSESTPFVTTPADCNVNGEVVSVQEVTVFGLPPGGRAIFTDLNSASNGNRFAQPTGIIDGNGTFTFRLRFADAPPTEAGGTYTGLIRLGTSSIYFSWVVTVLTSGIAKPTILQILDLEGDLYTAPTNPSYLTQSSVGSLEIVGTVSGLTADTTSADLSATSDTGTGLTAAFSTDGNGAITFIDIKTGGTGYTFGQTVTFDLSSLNGSSAQSFNTLCNPVTGGSASFTVTAYEGFNTGAFKQQEWQISPTEDFSSFTTSIVTTSGTQVSVPLGAGPSAVYYARFRYESTDSVQSAFSSIIRSGTGSLISTRYILRNYGSGSTRSWDSGNIYLTPKPYLWLVATDNGTNRDTQCFGVGRGGRWSTRYSGQNAKGAVWVQLRQPIQATVTGIDGSGGVSAYLQIGSSQGVNDYYITNPAPFLEGSGTGCTLVLSRDANGFSKISAVGTPGTGYQVNDIITFTPPIGNGSTTTDTGSDTTTGFSSKSLDSFWDILLHGVGGSGGGTPGGGAGGGGNIAGGDGGTGVTSPGAFGEGGEGGTVSSSIYGGSGNTNNGDSGTMAGGGAGGGFGVGKHGGNGQQGTPGGGGGGGGATYRNAALQPDGAGVPTQYPSKGVDLYNGSIFKVTVTNTCNGTRLF